MVTLKKVENDVNVSFNDKGGIKDFDNENNYMNMNEEMNEEDSLDDKWKKYKIINKLMQCS